MQVIVTINNIGKMINVDVNVKNWLIKGYKGYAWNPSNCECECDKSCDFGEYLDYENCRCRKRLVDKLVEECNENIDEEVKILDKSEDKCSSCILHTVLFSILFTINVGIGAYFFCFRECLKKMFTRETMIY